MLSSNDLIVVDIPDLDNTPPNGILEWCSVNLGEGMYNYWGGMPEEMNWMWSSGPSTDSTRFWFRKREHAAQFLLTWL